MTKLEVKNLSRTFGSTRAVEDVSLNVDEGELVCLLGPSGSGKSTVLRMIGGFERPSTGSILIDGADVTNVPPERRATGMVFQSHALWTHMNVFLKLMSPIPVALSPRGPLQLPFVRLTLLD